MDYPKVSIVTPSFNKGAFIEETIRSILDQQYPNLEYIIIDGGSTDNSIDVIKKYASSLKYWVSEKDDGMYHALERGFQQATGDIMGWLNSDDILHRKSLFTVAEIFHTLQAVDWIQGYPTVIDDAGRIIYSRRARNNKLDFYKKKYRDGIFIQQESTFWRKKLWEKAGSHISTDYKYAGDFELWMRFFTNAELYNTSAIIGGFRMYGDGQITTNHYDAYLQECDRIIDEMILKSGKHFSKHLENNKSINFFKRSPGKPVTEPQLIEYDFAKKRFYLAGL